MNGDDLSSLSSNTGPAVTEVDEGISILSSLRVEEIPADDAGLTELSERLDSANTWASGVEAKLDVILGTLDNLLSSLEPNDSDKPQEATTPPSEHPPSEQS